jgi:hypothetical protein
MEGNMDGHHNPGRMRLQSAQHIKAANQAPKRNNGLGALPRPLPVICGYWTKAIALPRVPGIFASALFPAPLSLCGDTR